MYAKILDITTIVELNNPMHLSPFNLGDIIEQIYFFYFVLYLVEFHKQELWIDIVYVISNGDF